LVTGVTGVGFAVIVAIVVTFADRNGILRGLCRTSISERAADGPGSAQDLDPSASPAVPTWEGQGTDPGTDRSPRVLNAKRGRSTSLDFENGPVMQKETESWREPMARGTHMT
jgi:hypothetical protein